MALALASWSPTTFLDNVGAKARLFQVPQLSADAGLGGAGGLFNLGQRPPCTVNHEGEYLSELCSKANLI
jgi:hypothetical protein